MWKIVKVVLALYFIYYSVSLYMTQRFIADFAGSEHNTVFARSNMISIADVAAEKRAFTHKEQICPDITSSRGEITLSFVGDEIVCCDTDELMLPYRNVGSNREYVCGKWPSIEVITQPLSKTKLQLQTQGLSRAK
ncbi:hypothetical protein OCF84_21390 (plasmid) [Shewanella xiamenensis]|uniref:Uncharacterized protein n=1 Tax=Shewanella xiamenensis TaxID=332186 RepID=A0ABT6UDM3_9GAMM|nr:hypothetical protein [Shewanella xiamenensis]MDI5832568.1 hypothetical protein [Shewanella xiamenensis]WHF57813.1 hypothetical protein OCF84_21390 [Shewanella xiamenensis]